MVVRRRRRWPMRRRRRSRSEQYRLHNCRTCFNVYGDIPCTNPLTDVFTLLSMSIAKSASDTTEITSPSDRFIVFDGMKFQSEYFHDPLKTVDCSNANPTVNPNASALDFILSIWEALVVLPLAQGSSIAPAYLPNFPSGIFQQGDVADRLLWKRLSWLHVQGIKSQPFLISSNPDGTFRSEQSGPVVVKARVRLDDRHALFYVRQFVHDIFLNGQAPCDQCTSCVDCDACDSDNTNVQNCGAIPIETDFWATMFYHARR